MKHHASLDTGYSYLTIYLGLLREEYEASREPYEDEKQLCSTLITYLQPHLVVEPTPSGGDTSPSGTSTEQAGATAPEKLTVIGRFSFIISVGTGLLSQ